MPAKELRPPVWVGHISLSTNAIDATHSFMLELGMRPIFRNEGISVLELRGGTHILLFQTEPPDGSNAVGFDLMVDSLDESWAEYSGKGLAPSEIVRGRPHDTFTLVEPSGHVITINSTHVSDKPV